MGKYYEVTPRDVCAQDDMAERRDSIHPAKIEECSFTATWTDPDEGQQCEALVQYTDGQACLFGGQSCLRQLIIENSPAGPLFSGKGE